MKHSLLRSNIGLGLGLIALGCGGAPQESNAESATDDQAGAGSEVVEGTDSKADQPSPSSSLTPCPRVSYHRDWQNWPATVTIQDTNRTLYAFSDIHGELTDAFDLLTRAGIVSGSPENITWLVGNSILVIAGDSLNKGTNSVGVLRMLIQLEKRASDAGGAVFVAAGNHEIAFLAYPTHPKFKVLHDELSSKGMSVCDDLYSPHSEIGEWLHKRMAALVINGVFIGHSGNTLGLSLEQIGTGFRTMVDTNRFDDAFACGTASDGYFNTDAWWANADGTLSEKRFADNLDGVGAKQLMFGHDPLAFSSKYEMAAYFGNSLGRALVKLDMAISSPESRGSLYRCSEWLADGGCKVPLTFVNAQQDGPADWKPISIHYSPPPLPDVPPEIGNWCTGKGNQRP